MTFPERAAPSPQPSPTRERERAAGFRSADDERNPPITGLTEQAIGKIKGARLLMIPARPNSRGHGSGGLAKLYAKELDGWLAGVPQRAEE